MSSQPTQPSQAEPVPVQLTRMEGVMNLIAYQQGEMKDDMKSVRTEVAALSARVHNVETAQAASAGASSTWRTWVPIILAAAAVIAAFLALKS